MTGIRNKLLLIFLGATLVPIGTTFWIMSRLLDEGLRYTSTAQLDELSKSLEMTARGFYQQSREALEQDAAQGRGTPRPYEIGGRRDWPPEIGAFWDSGEAERFRLTGREGDRLELLLRAERGVRVYSRPLGPVGMDRLSKQYAKARESVERARVLDFRRGMTWTLIVAAVAIWLVTMAAAVLFTWRVSRPLREKEAWAERLAGSQAIARKMAHELKNSLTPIRLTMEEILARQREGGATDDGFLQQAAAIVADEVAALERRVRAFSEFSSEPPVRLADLDMNALLQERIQLLRSVHQETVCEVDLDPKRPMVRADEDLAKGILTNLLANAAEAAGSGGRIRALTCWGETQVAVEVHDNGPGLSAEAARAVFEPAISSKKGGMGLGLSIARRSALLCGGDLVHTKGDLGGAAFRLTLPAAHGAKANPAG